MIKTEKELLKAIRRYLTGNVHIKKIDGVDKIYVNYEKTYLLLSILVLLREDNEIKEFKVYGNGWFAIDIGNDKTNKTNKRSYQYANCTLVYGYPISYNESFENILDNKYLHSNISNTTNVTSICSTNNNTIITFSVYGYFNFDKNGKCLDYEIINIDDDLYIFNSYDEFKQENLEIINILTNKSKQRRSNYV